MVLGKVSSGSDVIDELLGGGFETDAINIIYGPPGSGKTNLCILSLKELARANKKIIYVDTEGGFSVERLKQICPDDYEEIMSNVYFLRPNTFDEQKKAFAKLSSIVNDHIGLIIVDSISMLYRLEFGKEENNSTINKELAWQLSYLNDISRRKNIPVIITNHVYNSFEDKTKVNVIGGDMIRSIAKCLVEFLKHNKNNRSAILRKHRSRPESDPVFFEIYESGFRKPQEKE